jgi:hypothetical protein
MTPDLDDTALEKLFGLLDRADTDRLSDLMRMVGLDPLTDLRHADVRGANLSGQDFTHADLEGADLHLAQMSGTKLSQARLRGANLSHANLSHADLSHADLSDADLSHADLSDADLSGVVLHGANIDGANLSGAILDGAGSAVRSSVLGVPAQPGAASFVVHVQESSLVGDELPLAAQPALGSWRTQIRLAEAGGDATIGQGSGSGSTYYASADSMVSIYAEPSPAYASAGTSYHATESAVQRLTDTALQLSEAQSSDAPALTQLARAHPVSAMAMAVGAGFVLAKLLTRRG